MDNEVKVLNCPCCGKEARVMIPMGHYFTFYQVVCTGCGLASKSMPSAEATVGLWNRREGDSTNEQVE